MPRTLVIAALSALMIGTAVWLLWPGSSERAPAPELTARQPAAPPPALDPPPLAPEPARSASAPPGDPTAPATAPEAFVSRESDETLEASRFDAVLPREPKLLQQRMSQVPHQVLGAWDDQPEEASVGLHRTFVAVVDPGLSDQELESLVWDIRQTHRDAEVLDVRVYDSPEAASMTGDDSALRASHLVAEVKRNDRLDFRQVRVRGVDVD